MIEKLSQSEVVSREDTLDYKNPKLKVDDRVSDLLNRMTIEEKVAQMLCIWGQKKSLFYDKDGNLDLKILRSTLDHGLGQIARLSDTNSGQNAKQMAVLANTLQRFFAEETRLGIPVFFHEECLHGLAAKDSASYPLPIALASTFNPPVIQEIFRLVAKETRSRGAHQALTPVLDVARDPRWGRVEETFGEDPYLVAQMALSAVRGLQGNGEFTGTDRVVATLKHFAAHGQPESGTNCGPADVSERALRDTFLYPFKVAIDKGNAFSVMASYNEIDGVPSHANSWLLRDVLRKEWGFKGFVVSDYYAITELHQRKEATSHSVAESKEDAALLAARAGVNIEFPDLDCYPSLVHLVRDGRLEESVIDELVAPLLRFKFLLGLFETPYVDPELAQDEQRTREERDIALRAAREAMTLLKNDGAVLPLKLKAKSVIAVIGPNADRRLLGGYSGKPVYYTSVLEGIKEKVGSGASILYSEGCGITVKGSWEEDAVTLPSPEEDQKSICEAVTTAKKADVVILVLGGNEQTSREGWSWTHLGDRASLELVGRQNDLAKAIVETGKPVVVLLFNGRPNSINYIASHVPAILECWYLGQETGRAVADVLFGDHSPAGKLPISIPRSAGHIPSFYNYKPSARRGYLFDDISPLYHFGFGLSYTTFKFSGLRLEKSVIRTDESTGVSVDVTNTGEYAGEEVVQLYVRDIVSSVTRPVKELKGFAKISLRPKESKTVTINICPEQLSFTNIHKKFTVEPGDFEIMVGNSSRDEDLAKVMLRVV